MKMNMDKKPIKTIGLKTPKIALFMLSALLCGHLGGCAPKPPAPCTPEEAAIDKAEEQAMVRDVLYRTDPRNMNRLPKVVPEFWTTVPKRRCGPEKVCPPE